MSGAPLTSRWVLLAAALGALPATSCSQTPDAVPLRSLERSGKIALLCLDLGAVSAGQADPANPDSPPRAPLTGYSLEDCQARRRANKEGGSDVQGLPSVAEVRLYALVNQDTRGEVALLDVADTSVVDADVTSPGFNFLPVGAQPVDLVVTPESTAAFVASGEVNRPGIYALPTHRLTNALPPGAPGDVRPTPSLLSWPACALPARPGAISMLVAPASSVDPATGLCQGAEPNYTADTPELLAQLDVNHPNGDLSREQQRPGVRKLMVTLPSEGEMLVIDAQALLDRAPGTFDVCPIERRYKLDSQPEPVELTGESSDDICPPRDVSAQVPPSPLCPVRQPTTVDNPVTASAFPVAVAQAEGTVYIADRNVPVIHSYDMADPCNPVRLPPLLPTSFDRPWRKVTTRALSVSPITSDNRRYLYAIDDLDSSAMVFDIAPGGERTPLVRSRPEFFPYSSRDRLNLGAPIKDITFVQQDFYPYDSNGTKVPGVRCDPFPEKNATPGASYQTEPDLTGGAIPSRLRGVFGVAALSTGQVVFIDVDDYDADCRRTRSTTSLPDWVTGCDTRVNEASNTCENDRPENASGESTCRAVVRHEVRSRNSILTTPSLGRHEPSMASFPQLSLDGVTLATDADTNGEASRYPKLLGPINTGAADGRWVFTSDGVTQTGTGDPTPTSAVTNFVVADTREPRASIDQTWSLVYEGVLVSTLNKIGRLHLDPSKTEPLGLDDPNQDRSERRGLFDPYGNYCYLGIHDEEMARLEGYRLYPGRSVADDEARERFARSHTDWVEITNELLDENDPYWDAQGDACSYARCRVNFGTAASPTASRSFRIHKAYNDKLLLRGDRESELVSDEYPDTTSLADDLYPDALTVNDVTGGDPLDPSCCFPTQVSYQVRGGQTWIATGSVSSLLQHTTVGAGGRCTLLGVDPSGEVCDGSFATRTGRLYEVDSLSVNSRATKARTHQDPYAFRNPYFTGLVYAGTQASRRNMSFTWTMAGGFQALQVDVGRGSTQVAPQSLVYHPALGAEILVTDGALQGVLSVDMFSFIIARNFL